MELLATCGTTLREGGLAARLDGSAGLMRFRFLLEVCSGLMRFALSVRGASVRRGSVWWFAEVSLSVGGGGLMRFRFPWVLVV